MKRRFGGTAWEYASPEKNRHSWYVFTGYADFCILGFVRAKNLMRSVKHFNCELFCKSFCKASASIAKQQDLHDLVGNATGIMPVSIKGGKTIWNLRKPVAGNRGDAKEEPKENVERGLCILVMRAEGKSLEGFAEKTGHRDTSRCCRLYSPRTSAAKPAGMAVDNLE